MLDPTASVWLPIAYAEDWPAGKVEEPITTGAGTGPSECLDVVACVSKDVDWSTTKKVFDALVWSPTTVLD